MSNPEEDQSTVFTGHKNNDELKAEAQAKKQAKKLARQVKEKKPYLRGVIILLAVLVAIAGVAIFAGATGIFNSVIDPKGVNTKLGHFYSDDTPEMSQEGIKGVITEAYYTYDKHLALILSLSNGLNIKQYMTSIDVTVKNEKGDVIASGSTDKIDKNFYINPMGTSTFTFYISPKYVKIPNDNLNQISYEITTTGKVDDPSVLSTTTAGTSAATTAKTSAAGAGTVTAVTTGTTAIK